ncbi:MAG: DNA polymerase III subunit gamma/tau [Clostridia bacterium]|nr:DNA polymerase III subunit gamma/tau [Clostridia bacterium]
MAYQALYRKWRPMVFDDVVGQQHITATIKNEILNNKISHAYLFTGTRGTGKTSTAKIFSRAVNCLNPKDGNPCNECEICKGILSERILDVIEIDAASNTGVDNIRDIIDQTKYAAAESRCRVYIIDEVHMLSAGAFNALLKTLEEPTQGVIFILATTEIHKVPATIMSRCQRFDFKTINITDIVSRIKYILENENIASDDAAVRYVAQLGDGSMRDSLSILDQCLAFKENNLTYEDVVDTVGAIDNTFLYNIACSIADGNAADAVSVFERCIAEGKNTDYFAEGLLEVYRSTLLYKISGNLEYAGLKSENTQKTAEKYTAEKLMYCIEVITKLLNDIKFSSAPKVYIEMALIKMASPALDDSNAAVLARISELENNIKSGKVVSVKEAKDIAEPFEVGAEEIPVPDDLPWEEPPAPVEENAAADVTVPVDAQTKYSGKSNMVCENWSEVENAIMSDGSITLYMALRGVRPTPAGDNLHLVFNDAESRDRCAKGDNKAKIEEYIRQVFGFDINIECYSKNQVIDAKPAENGDFFGKIEQFSRDFPENIEIYEN